jgi:BspA type Leucine rich repeat region (6 copies)
MQFFTIIASVALLAFVKVNAIEENIKDESINVVSRSKYTDSIGWISKAIPVCIYIL